jgi:hypothetical protein
VFAITTTTIIVFIPQKCQLLCQPTAISTQQLPTHLCAAEYTWRVFVTGRLIINECLF